MSSFERATNRWSERKGGGDERLALMMNFRSVMQTFDQLNSRFSFLSLQRMAKLQRNQEQVLSTSSLPIESESWTNSPNNDKYLTFNILGKIYNVKESLFQKNPNLFYGTVFADRELLEKYYQADRQQYVIDISPAVFECILQYYTTEKLLEPSNIHLDYFKEICHQFRIDTSSLELNGQYERYVPRQSSVQLIHVILEYPDCE